MVPQKTAGLHTSPLKYLARTHPTSGRRLLRNNGLQEYIATIAGSDLRSDKVELATELAGIMLQGMPAKLETGAWQRLKEWFYTSTLGNAYRNLSYAWNDGTTLNDLINNIL